MIRLRLSLFALSFVLLPGISLAQMEETTTGSGAVTPPPQTPETESAELQSQRELRTRDFRQKLLQSSKPESSFVNQEAVFRRKRAELRRDCREDIRRANRDSKFPTILRCMRGELALELEFRDEESAWIAVAPGIPSTLRKKVIERLDLLTDAIDAVILAIDGKVYATNDDLLEARKNLLTKYRLPYAGILLQARAEMFLTWAQELIQQLDAIRKELGEDTWLTNRTCFTEQEAALRREVAQEAGPSATVISQSMKALGTCTRLMLQSVSAGSSSSKAP